MFVVFFFQEEAGYEMVKSLLGLGVCLRDSFCAWALEPLWDGRPLFPTVGLAPGLV